MTQAEEWARDELRYAKRVIRRQFVVILVLVGILLAGATGIALYGLPEIPPPGARSIKATGYIVSINSSGNIIGSIPPELMDEFEEWLAKKQAEDN